jgi:hypothetical protein
MRNADEPTNEKTDAIGSTNDLVVTSLSDYVLILSV